MAASAARLGTAGVALFRTNLLIQELGKHPEYYFERQPEDELKAILTDGITTIARAFCAGGHKRPVWMRTMDFDSAELALYEGAPMKRPEHNPALGLRGLAWELQEQRMLQLELEALRDAIAAGYDNLGVIFPLVRTVTEYEEARDMMRRVGLRPNDNVKTGVAFETPSAALQIEAFIDVGIDLAFIGINDMTQYTLVCDRTNKRVAHLYDATHPSVLYLIRHVLDACTRAGVETTMNYWEPLGDHFGELLAAGLDSVTVLAHQIEPVGDLLFRIENEDWHKIGGSAPGDD